MLRHIGTLSPQCLGIFYSILSNMYTFLRSTALVVAGLAARALAGIGPVTDFHIVNAAVSPDGFSRQAVLAEGVFPGPLITGNKVLLCCLTLSSQL